MGELRSTQSSPACDAPSSWCESRAASKPLPSGAARTILQLAAPGRRRERSVGSAEEGRANPIPNKLRKLQPMG